MPTVALTLSANSAYVGLDSVTLTWSSKNATTCTASGAWTGTQALSGSMLIKSTVVGDAPYSLQCIGEGGSVSANTMLHVTLLSNSSCQAQHWERAGQPNEAVQMGEYVPVNSVGADIWVSIPGFSACFSASMDSPGVVVATWNWNIPLPPETPAQRTPKGYQGVFYGRAPHYPGMPLSTTRMPALVSAIPPTLQVAFDLDVTPAGQFNTLFDIDFLPTATASDVRQVELMIITDLVGSDTTRVGLPTVTIGGVNYWVLTYTCAPHPLYPNDPSSGKRGIQFVSQTRVLSGVVPLRPFVDYLLGQGWIQPSDYMVDIDFGIEMDTGAGTANLRSYSITWK